MYLDRLPKSLSKQEGAVVLELVRAAVQNIFGCYKKVLVLNAMGWCTAESCDLAYSKYVLAQAHNALMLGGTSTAIAAAANLLLSPHTHAMYSIAGALSTPAPGYNMMFLTLHLSLNPRSLDLPLHSLLIKDNR